jgi:hypothetical protein
MLHKMQIIPRGKVMSAWRWYKNIVSNFFDRIISVDLRISIIILMLCTVIFAVVYIGSHIIAQSRNTNASHVYFSTIYKAKQDNKYEEMLANYEKMTHPVYKMLLGIEQIDYLCANNNTKEAEKLLSDVVQIKDLPQYLTQALQLRLIGLQFTNGTNIDSIAETMRSSNKDKVFQLLFDEIEMNLQMLKGDTEDCHNSIESLYSNRHLPRDMRARIEELQYIIQSK